MRITDTTPIEDGYYMPAEYDRHKATIMIWPVRTGSWPYNAVAAQNVFVDIAHIISRHEKVYILADEKHYAQAEARFMKIKDAVTGECNKASEDIKAAWNIEVVCIETDDAWARDVCPTFVKNGHTGDVRGINWKFNAWGGDYDGLYKNWEKDDKAALQFCNMTGYDCYDANPFVLEGGSIHSDGEGTVIVTDSCLLSKGRNPDMSREQIEHNLKKYLGAKKIIWIPYGIYNDETNGHIDNICAFTSETDVVLAWTDDENDPQYKLSSACLKALENSTTADDRKITVHKLPLPKPVLITEHECEGLDTMDGLPTRTANERLAASYVNFYISNGAIVMPFFNVKNDEIARNILASLFPTREVIGVYARDILIGGGNFHCLTQQIPLS